MYVIFTLLLMINFIVYSSIKDSDDGQKDKRSAFQNYFFLSSAMYIFVIFFLTVKPPFLMNQVVLFSIATITGVLFFKFMVASNKKSKDNSEIKAKQMSYWGIDVDDILEKYKYRIVKKKGRNEVVVDGEEYFIKINKADYSKELQPIIISDMSNTPDLKLLRDVDFLRGMDKPLYKKLFNKIEEFVTDAELNIDYDAVLKENKHILEFFFLDLWERVAYYENIGTTTLSVLCEDENDEALIGALDSAKSINCQKDGIVLFAHYLNFKGRLK